MITGKDIINLGFKPGKWFADVIEYANQNQLSGDSLKSYIESVRPKHIEPHSEAVDFYKNIRAENEEEADNVKMVLDIPFGNWIDQNSCVENLNEIEERN